MRSDAGSNHNINFVEGLGVRMPDGEIHACRDISHTLCGVEIPEEAKMAALNRIKCRRCQDAMKQEEVIQ